MIFTCTSTTQDLLDAHEAHITARTGMRSFFRFFVIVMGLAWLVGGLIIIYTGEKGYPTPIWLILGTIILWFFLLKPILTRRHIRTSNPPTQNLHLAFDMTGIKINAENVGNYRRTWAELAGFRNTPHRVLLYFTDGMVHWIPSRAFSDNVQRTEFLALLRNNIPKDEEVPDH